MNESLKIFGACAAGLAAGTFIGFKYAEKKLIDVFEERLAKETAEMRVFYSSVKKKYDTPEAAVKDLIPEPNTDPRQPAQKVQYNKIIKKEEYTVADDEEGAKAAEDLQESEFIRKNVFTSPENTEDDTDKPYLIDQEAFMQNDPGHEQDTLTYFENDNVLVDERDDIVDDIANIVGKNFMDHFGKGSSDPNVAHVRNVRLLTDFEICRSEGSFAKEVLGDSDED